MFELGVYWENRRAAAKNARLTDGIEAVLTSYFKYPNGSHIGKVDAAIFGPQTNDSMVEKKRTRLPCWQMPAKLRGSC